MAPVKITITIKGTVSVPAGYKLGTGTKQLCVGIALASDDNGAFKPSPSIPPVSPNPPGSPYLYTLLVTPATSPQTGTYQIVLDDATTAGHGAKVNQGTSLYVVFSTPYTNDEGYEFTIPLGGIVVCQAKENNETITVDASYQLQGCDIDGIVNCQDPEDNQKLPFAGVPVILLDKNLAEVDQTETDANGHYCFHIGDTSQDKQFTLRFAAEMPFKKNHLILSPNTITIQTRARLPYTLPNLVYTVALAQVIGQVKNGKQGLSNVTPQLVEQKTGKPAPTNPTDPFGFYQFTNLTPGEYQLNFPHSFIDNAGRSWELKDGQSGNQTLQLNAGEIVTAEPVVYQLEEHKIVWTVTSNGRPAPGKLVEIKDNAGNVIGQARTGFDGRVVFLLDEPGDYKVLVYSDDREHANTLTYPVSVHSTVTGKSDVPPGPGSSANGGVGGNGLNGDLKEAVVDSQAYPLLTEAVSAPSTPGPAVGTPAAASGATALGATVQVALREVLGWRPKADDPKAFLTALSQSFKLEDVEGHVVHKWTPRSYAVTVADDLGAVTGAQASIHNRAKVALDHSLPMLDGLVPLDPEVTQADIDAIRAIVRSEFTQLVNELGIVGGPRVQRVDELFRFLLGTSESPSPENPGGHLGELGNRLSMVREKVNTVDDEQNLTNYLIINDYVIGLKASWKTVRGYFDRTGNKEPYMGTQLVLVSQGLTAIAEAVQQTSFAMDSVFLGPAERQTISLWFKDGGTILVPKVTGDDDINPDGTYTFKNAPPLVVSELLDWVYRVATDEAPRMIQDSGKDGVIAIFPVVNKLRKLVQGSLTKSAGGVQDPKTQALPAGYTTPRVTRAIAELADELDDVAELAGQIYVRAKPPRERLEISEVLDALNDPDVIDAIKAIAAQRKPAVPSTQKAQPPNNGARPTPDEVFL